MCARSLNSGPMTKDFGRTIVAWKLVALQAISVALHNAQQGEKGQIN